MRHIVESVAFTYSWSRDYTYNYVLMVATLHLNERLLILFHKNFKIKSSDQCPQPAIPATSGQKFTYD